MTQNNSNGVIGVELVLVLVSLLYLFLARKKFSGLQSNKSLGTQIQLVQRVNQQIANQLLSSLNGGMLNQELFASSIKTLLTTDPTGSLLNEVFELEQFHNHMWYTMLTNGIRSLPKDLKAQVEPIFARHNADRKNKCLYPFGS